LHEPGIVGVVTGWAIAASIDLTIGVVSWALHLFGRAGRGVLYAFLTFLISISWFGNLAYSFQYVPARTGVWMNAAFWLVAPWLVAALPVFTLVFTLVIGKLGKIAIATIPVLDPLPVPIPTKSNEYIPELTPIPTVIPPKSNGYKEQIKGIIERYNGDGRAYTYKDIAKETGASIPTIKAYAPKIRQELGIVA
jgi:hypothetical protein